MFLFVLLLLTWVVLAGNVNVNLPNIAGIISIFLCIVVYRRAKRLSPRNIHFTLNIKEFSLYIPVLLIDIIISNINVAKDVLKNHSKPRIIEIANNFKYNSASACYCVSVILTPGSVVLHENSERFLVHVLDSTTGRSILSKSLVKRIEKMTLNADKAK